MNFSSFGINFNLLPRASSTILNKLDSSSLAMCQQLPGTTNSFYIQSIGSRIELLDIIGNGAYGSVYTSNFITPTNGTILTATKTIKIPKHYDLSQKTQLVNSIIRETLINIIIYTTCVNNKLIPCVPQIHFMCISDEKIMIIQELLDGDLGDFIEKTSVITLDSYIDIIANLAFILHHLQNLLGFSHRDLKINNIAFKSTAVKSTHISLPHEHIDFTLTKGSGIRLYLIDFGFSCLMFDGTQISSDAIFNPRTPCFREGRDMAQSLYSLLMHNKRIIPEISSFLNYCLNVRINGIVCSIPKTCEAFGMKNWLDIYAFLDRDDVDYSRTKPINIIRMIQNYVNGHALPIGTNDILGSSVSFTPSLK